MADNKQLQETLTRLLYAGVGYAAESSKKVQKNVDELIKKGKINEREGKKIVDQVAVVAEAKRKELETKINKAVEKYRKEGLSQINVLTKKIKSLEAEVEKKIKGASTTTKPATKKAVVKKAAPKKAAKKAPAKKAPAKKAAAKTTNTTEATA